MRENGIKLRIIIMKIINHNSRRDGMNPIRLNWNNDDDLLDFFSFRSCGVFGVGIV